MRIAPSIFVGSIAVLAALASPALANGSSPNSHANANAQAVEDVPNSSPCHAYQKGPDGSWAATKAAAATLRQRRCTSPRAIIRRIRARAEKARSALLSQPSLRARAKPGAAV
jgi:hypothetical protein